MVQKLVLRERDQLQEKLIIHHLHQMETCAGCVKKDSKDVFGRGVLDVSEEFIEKVVQPI